MTPTSPLANRNLLEELVPEKISREFGEPFVAAHDAMELYTRVGVREVFERIFRVVPETETGFTRAGIVSRTPVAPAAEPLLDWMLGFSKSQGDLGQEGDRYVPRFGARLEERSVLRERAILVQPSAAAAYAIVDRCVDGAMEFLQGKMSGESIVFALSALNLWFDYFDNRNFLYAVNNRLAALVLADELSTGPGSSEVRSIVEFGGGAGSAGLAFLDEVESRGGGAPGPIRYVFTEPIAAFGRRGARSLKGRLPAGWELASGNADLDRPLVEQDLAPQSFDAVWAVNTLHVAKDLEKSLGYIFDILRPGGVVVIGECVRPFPAQILYTEFVFNFLANFCRVATGPNRATHGFLTPEEWERNFVAAGFTGIKSIPDIARLRESYPKFFTAALVARKP